MASASTSLAGSISARRLARSNTFAGGESGLLDAIEAWIERGAGNAERLRAVAARLAQLKEKAEAKAVEVASAAELQPVEEESGMEDASVPTNAQEQVSTKAEAAIQDVASAEEAVVQDEKDKLLPEVAPAKVSHDPDTPFTREAALAKLKSNDAFNYFELDALLASVESGAIAPLRGRWLCALHRLGGRLERRQDLPAEAFWTADELRREARRLGDGFGALFVALSYRWLTKDHPDPEAFHLKIVVEVLGLYFGETSKYQATGCSPLTAAYEAAGLDWRAADCAIFWDFAGLFQKPRSAVEEPLFLPGLKASNIWYGHARTSCWLQSELPAGFDGAAYEVSGWCFVEAAISAGVKEAGCRLDLGKRTQEAMDYAYTHDGNKLSNKLTGVCGGRRQPPLLPSDVKHLLETEKKFTNSSDTDVVATLYHTFFEAITGTAERLVFRELSWGPAEAAQLVRVLPSFERFSEVYAAHTRENALFT